MDDARAEMLRTETAGRIERDFRYHAPLEGQIERYESLRSAGRALAHLINKFAPPSREQSLALTKVEEAVMWANAAIARNESA
jgi:hypothetical protein